MDDSLKETFKVSINSCIISFDLFFHLDAKKSSVKRENRSQKFGF